MPTTSNFGWTTPADTDLVKDGAAAIRTLGNGIDTSLVDLKGGTTGQVLSKASNTDLDYSWVTPELGDITAVTVSSPITGGGTTGSVNIAIQDGTTAQKGAVQLEDSTSSTSTTKAATPNSVKTAYDLANGAIAKSIVDAKADLITATADNTPARLAVGNDGETLVADSSTSTGLRWQGNYAAGKNAIINGDFRINQRNFSSATASGYGFDRWNAVMAGDGTATYSAQTFTLGTAPVAGYEGTNFARFVTTGQTTTAVRSNWDQRIESVRTFAGQTVTVSLWAKAASGTPSITLELVQNFGTGGSPSSSVTGIGSEKKVLTTSWARYTMTVAVPSIAGKTIGTSGGDHLALAIWVSAGSDFNSRSNSLGIQTNTFDIWGVQVEAGNVATAFQTATGTLAGELAAAQRYYYRLSGTAAYSPHAQGIAASTTALQGIFHYPVTMRVAPTSIDFSNLGLSDAVAAPIAITALTLANNTSTATLLTASVASGLTQYRYYQIVNNNSTSGYLAFSAEL